MLVVSDEIQSKHTRLSLAMYNAPGAETLLSKWGGGGGG